MVLSRTVSESSQESVQEALGASSSDEELLRAQYRVLRTLRQGGFSLVKLAKHLLTTTVVAVKVLDKKENPFFTTEVDIFKSLDHPNVVKLFEVIETEQRLYFVMEYLDGGDLVDRLQESGRMEEEEARPLFKQIISAVKYCHDNHIAHRDLKLENILLDGKGTAKLCDFGLSTRYTPGEELDRECGTVSFWAPELFLHQKYQGPKVDVWSLGVVLYCIVMGKLPFRGESPTSLKRRVLSGRFPIRKTFSQDLRGLFAFLLTANPEQRPSLEQVMQHPWFRKTEPARPSKTVSKEPDLAILDIMCYLGYDSWEVQAALSCRTFNSAMATYFLLLEQKDRGQDLTHYMRLQVRGPPPCPWQSDPPSAFTRKTASPASRPTTCLPTEQQKHGGDQKVTIAVCHHCHLWNPCLLDTEGETQGHKPLPATATAGSARGAEGETEAGSLTVPPGPAAAVSPPFRQLSDLICPSTEQEFQGGRGDSLPSILYNTWTWGIDGEMQSSLGGKASEREEGKIHKLTSGQATAENISRNRKEEEKEEEEEEEKEEEGKLSPSPGAAGRAFQCAKSEMEGSTPFPLGPAAAEASIPPSQLTDLTKSPTNDQVRGWKKLKKRIGKCLRLCCMPR